jgi:dihydrofolate reductase
MGKVVVDLTMSLDGYIAGPNDDPELPLGEGGEKLHQWIFGLAGWRKPHGLAGGERNRDSEIVEESLANRGAVILGRRMFDNAAGFGDNPPFHLPAFVLTHEQREPEAKEGGTTFTFVTDGVESAFEQASAAAGDKDITIMGGANTVQQFLEAGLIDEIEVHVVPLFLGGGVKLFGDHEAELERVGVVDSPAVTHLKYRVVK